MTATDGASLDSPNFLEEILGGSPLPAENLWDEQEPLWGGLRDQNMPPLSQPASSVPVAVGEEGPTTGTT